MRLTKKWIVKKSMKTVGNLALLIGTLAVIQTSVFWAYEPKCPEELIR